MKRKLQYYEIRLDVVKPSKRAIKELELVIFCSEWETYRSRFYPIFTIKRRLEDRKHADFVKEAMINSVRKVTKRLIRVYETGYYELE